MWKIRATEREGQFFKCCPQTAVACRGDLLEMLILGPQAGSPASGPSPLRCNRLPGIRRQLKVENIGSERPELISAKKAEGDWLGLQFQPGVGSWLPCFS